HTLRSGYSVLAHDINFSRRPFVPGRLDGFFQRAARHASCPTRCHAEGRVGQEVSSILLSHRSSYLLLSSHRPAEHHHRYAAHDHRHARELFRHQAFVEQQRAEQHGDYRVHKCVWRDLGHGDVLEQIRERYQTEQGTAYSQIGYGSRSAERVNGRTKSTDGNSKYRIENAGGRQLPAGSDKSVCLEVEPPRHY